MSVVTMNMSSFEIDRNNSFSYDDEVMIAGRSPAPALQEHSKSPKLMPMPQHIIAMNNDIFMKRMYDIEINAEIFLKSMYAYQ